jgi:hypothetical protein
MFAVCALCAVPLDCAVCAVCVGALGAVNAVLVLCVVCSLRLFSLTSSAKWEPVGPQPVLWKLRRQPALLHWAHGAPRGQPLPVRLGQLNRTRRAQSDHVLHQFLGHGLGERGRGKEAGQTRAKR